ncbi:unnamed protein product [Didymodactylos carnosus]|uniref:Uncharacterized protein n=1 Tax=Didymodactylos carnosus TaxID=1234261 RepID=A0A814D9M1_9BILA|nr:unnamed protein product [Didymodactylos carnosus]CAF1290090.1 unnamed protein product [Didymodactylos carnosus]CAF3727069.1 unnamed protein product [Didymodactylos carnosus]CAF4094901.1 unnamed protein product [Didymodactylos carnosus]
MTVVTADVIRWPDLPRSIVPAAGIDRFRSNALLTYDVRLGYKTDENDFNDKTSQWKLYAKSRETRRLDCKPINHGLKTDPVYICEQLAFLELAALKYPYYLINLQIVGDKDYSQNIGKLMSLDFVVTPLEWFTLLFPSNWFQIFTEIRQGLFFCVLLTFWLVFAGEHVIGASFRFGSLLIATIICAILTVIWFCLSQFYETHWIWEHENTPPKIHYSGAFITGVYGMWNLYVFAILLLFSPSASNIVEDLVELNPAGSIVELCDTANPSFYHVISKTALE